MQNQNFFKNLGVGLGLRSQHYSAVSFATVAGNKIQWFEAISENYMGLSDTGAGRSLEILKSIRKNYPIVLHGVSMNIGSVDPLNLNYLKNLKDLSNIIQPEWISDHICWTGVNGKNLHDLMPMPFTMESVNHLSSRISAVQDYLKRPILLENVSSYITFDHSEMSEWDFINSILKTSGCGLLLDVNNVYVSSRNHGFDAIQYLDAIDSKSIGQIHLAGHSDEGSILIDTHDGPVCDEVWDLYRHAVERFGNVSSMIEWDANIPEYNVLSAEAEKIYAIQS